MTYISPERIALAVCRLLHVDQVDVLTRRRGPEVIRARVVIAGLCVEMSGCSPPEIARRAFGGQSHNAVQDRVRRWNLLEERDRDGWRWRVTVAVNARTEAA